MNKSSAQFEEEEDIIVQRSSLEEEMTRLIEILSRREVSASRFFLS